MRHHRKQPLIHRSALATALLALPMLACGPTVFADATALTIVGEPPPPPPPPPEPEPEPEPPKRVQVTADAIVIHDKILFETGKAVIRPESFDLMNEITTVVQDNPRIKKISIEGHTDSQGKDKYNKKLSDRRAASVKTYLVEHGVDEARLSTVGHGEENPIADNETPEGREENRRVEFHIVEQDELTHTVEVDPETGKEQVVDSKTTAKPTPASEGPSGGVTARPSKSPEGATK